MTSLQVLSNGIWSSQEMLKSLCFEEMRKLEMSFLTKILPAHIQQLGSEASSPQLSDDYLTAVKLNYIK